ncbi:MAG: hypothetical protein GX053_12795 [Tissierella sp.]|nr:hypothetical protein [Tissierella sp.]
MTINYYKKTEYLLYNYKMIEISIENMEQEIEYLKNNDGTSGLSYDGISTSPTNKTSNPTENVALSNSEKIHYLEHNIRKNKRLLDSVNRALEGLTNTERIILQQKYIEGKQWWQVSAMAGYSESWSKSVRKEAINKLIIGMYGER